MMFFDMFLNLGEISGLSFDKIVLKMTEAVVRSCSVKKVLLKTLQNSKKIPVLLSFFNKVTNLRLATLLKTRLRHGCFPVYFAKFLRTPFHIRPPPVAAS